MLRYHREGEKIIPQQVFKLDITMENNYMENKFIAGDIVYAKIDPSSKLVVRRYINRIYYCKVLEHPDRKDLVYFERELQ